MSTLYDKYYKEISAWDWNGIVSSAKNNADENYEGDVIGSEFLGTCFELLPSGKYYLPFAHSNVTEREAYRDEQYYAALEDIASNNGGWIESGEGDPTDIYFCLSIGRIDNRIEDDK